MQDMIAELTAANGYQHYEVSAYAKAGRARATTSITGNSATTSASAPARTQAVVPAPHPAPGPLQAAQGLYGAGGAAQEEREIGREEMGFEFMLNTLRLTAVSIRACSWNAPAWRSTPSNASSTRQRPRAAVPRPPDHPPDRTGPALPQ
jgi:hypothetical protein